jgi:hypothetical protein
MCEYKCQMWGEIVRDLLCEKIREDPKEPGTEEGNGQETHVHGSGTTASTGIVETRSKRRSSKERDQSGTKDYLWASWRGRVKGCLCLVTRGPLSLWGRRNGID